VLTASAPMKYHNCLIFNFLNYSTSIKPAKGTLTSYFVYHTRILMKTIEGHFLPIYMSSMQLKKKERNLLFLVYRY